MVENKHFEQKHAKCVKPVQKGEKDALCSRNQMCNETAGDMCVRYMIDVDNIHTEYEARCNSKA